MIIFFNIQGIVHIDWVPEGQTVNQVYCKEVLTTLCEQVRRKSPEIWKNSSWILHHHNMPAHNALSVTTFVAKHKIPVLEHPPYSRDLVPCDFFISKDQVYIKMNPFRVCRCSEGKSDGGNEEAIRKGPAPLLPTVENSHGAV
jgi:hypothetical protein